MIYKINDKYYINRGRKYIELDLIVNGDNISLKPKIDFIEDNDNLKVEKILFDDTFKKSYLKNNKKMDKEPTRTNKYR